MVRSATTLLVVLSAIQYGLVANADESFRVDDLAHPVPADLENLWESIKVKRTWETTDDTQIEGHFRGFVCRRFELFRLDDDDELLLRVVWFSGRRCRVVVRPFEGLSNKRRRLFNALFGSDDSGRRRSIHVVFVEIGRRRPGGSGQVDGEVDTDLETGGDGECEGDEDSQHAQIRIPVGFLSDRDRALLSPFTQIARGSFQRRLANSECVNRDETDTDDTVIDDSVVDDSDTDETVTDDTNTDTDDTDTDDTDTDDEDDDATGGDPRFGFTVRKFVAAADSLEFDLVEQRDVCIRAPGPAEAFREMRRRFRPRIDEGTSERISYRFRPNPNACRRGGGGSGGDDDPIEPTPDPLNTDADEVAEAIPAFGFD